MADVRYWRFASSWVVALGVILLAFMAHLMVPLLAGILAYTLVNRLASLIMRNKHFQLSLLAEKAAVSIITVVVFVSLTLGIVAIWHFIGHGGLSALLNHLVLTIDAAQDVLPTEVTASLPEWVSTEAALRGKIKEVLLGNAGGLAAVGKDGLAATLRFLIGLFIGVMAAWRFHIHPLEIKSPLLQEHAARWTELAHSTYYLITAQAKISLINAVLAAIFMGMILPIMGIHLPSPLLLAFLAFLLGLLPIVGNLISNTVIVISALSVSPIAAAWCLGFLVFIHKFEYLLQARFTSSTLFVPVWEMLAAMLALESIAGVAGLVFAPVGWAWVRSGLIARINNCTPLEVQ